MTKTYSRIERNLVAAALAAFITAGSFAASLTPAHAQAPAPRAYAATLTTALAKPASKVVNDVVWNCEGDTCTGPIDGSSTATACANVAKAFGPLAAFTTPKGEIKANDLARCNHH